MLSARRMMRRTATITSRTADTESDEYGNLLTVTGTSSVRCDLQLQAATESFTQIPAATFVLFLPPGTELDAAGAVTIDAKVYEVVGEPFEEPGSHVVAALERA